MSENDQAGKVKEERERYDAQRAEMAQEVKPEDVQAKAADGEALSLEELNAVNLPGSRPHNDEAEIGKRYEGSDYAPNAQPDLHAPAYVLAKQARLAAAGAEDTRVHGSATFRQSEEELAGDAKKSTKKSDQ